MKQDTLRSGDLGLIVRSEEKRYIIPRRTEDPSVTYGMLKSWIREFHRANEMKLPTGFQKRDKRQLLGMYYGMLRQYEITPSDIVPHRKYL